MTMMKGKGETWHIFTKTFELNSALTSKLIKNYLFDPLQHQKKRVTFSGVCAGTNYNPLNMLYTESNSARDVISFMAYSSNSRQAFCFHVYYAKGVEIFAGSCISRTIEIFRIQCLRPYFNFSLACEQACILFLIKKDDVFISGLWIWWPQVVEPYYL